MKLMFIMALLFTAPHVRPTITAQHPQFNSGTVRFSVENAGIIVNGTIKMVSAKINFKPGSLSQSVIEATADPATIQTGISIRDKHLKRSDYFHVDKFPVLHLISTSFRSEGKHKFSGQFNLTIKNITRPVTIIFTRHLEGGIIRYKGSFKINRLDFELGEHSIILNQYVKIEVEATTT